MFKDDNYEKFVGSLTNLPCFGMWPLLYRVTFLHLVSLPMLANLKNKGFCQRFSPCFGMWRLFIHFAFFQLRFVDKEQCPRKPLKSFVLICSWASVPLNF